MEIRKILFRKEMKLVTLLLTSLLIATVSAGTYLSLTMTSTVSVYQSNVYFVEGSDNGTTAGAILTLDGTNTTATITGLRAYPNATFTYENVTLVRNNATSGTTNIRLAPDVNPSANPADFEYVKFLLNATNPADRRWLNFTSSGAAWSDSGTSNWVVIPVSTQWSVVIMTKATSGATVNNSVTMTIRVDVD